MSQTEGFLSGHLGLQHPSPPTPHHLPQGQMVWISVKGDATGDDGGGVKPLSLPPKTDLSCIPAQEMGSRWCWSGDGR